MQTPKLLGFIFLAITFIFSTCERFTFPDSDPSNYGKLSVTGKKKLKKIIKDDTLITELIYDPSGNVTEIKHYNNSGDVSSEKLEYNDKGQLIQRSYWGNLKDHYIYKNGKLSEMYTENTLNPEYEYRLVYQYKGDRISRTEAFSRGKLLGLIVFEYDNKGNTVVRSEKYKTVEISAYRYTYDNKVNPFHFPGQSPIDMIQRNNPVKSYVSNVLFSHIPQEITTKYTYDTNGNPLTSFSYITEKQDVIINRLKYIYE